LLFPFPAPVGLRPFHLAISNSLFAKLEVLFELVQVQRFIPVLQHLLAGL
jgi:hypothetical protein